MWQALETNRLDSRHEKAANFEACKHSCMAPTVIQAQLVLHSRAVGLPVATTQNLDHGARSKALEKTTVTPI